MNALTCMSLLLCTGTALSLLQQIFANHGIHPSAQLYVWVQYMGHYLMAMRKMRNVRAPPLTTKQSIFVTAIGMCHVGAFLVVTQAVEKIGVALYQIVYSSGLVLTAIVSIIVLRKMPSSQQWVGIFIASAGLGQRGYVMMTLGGALKANSSPSDTLIGVGLAFFVTLMFCMVPILVEVVNKGQPDARKLTSDRIGASVSRIGVCTLTVYMCAHTFPKWNVLVAEPLAKAGIPLWEVGLVYLANTVIFYFHNNFYLETTRTAGAVGNGLVNAVRTATVVLGGYAFFCSEAKAHLCLDTDKMITVALLVVGGLVYTTAPPAYYLDDIKKDTEVKKEQ